KADRNKRRAIATAAKGQACSGRQVADEAHGNLREPNGRIARGPVCRTNNDTAMSDKKPMSAAVVEVERRNADFRLVSKISGLYVGVNPTSPQRGPTPPSPAQKSGVLPSMRVDEKGSAPRGSHHPCVYLLPALPRASCAASRPAIRPNTAPATRPVPLP